jgi:GAF domain-containing protein
LSDNEKQDVAMSEIPAYKKKLFDQKWLGEVLGAVPPIITVIYGAYAAAKNPATADATKWLIGGAVWLVVASAIRVRHAASDEDKKSPKEPLYAALRVVHATVSRHVGLDDQKDIDVLRVTLHRVLKPIENPKQIEQVTPYVGGDGGEPGRKFSIQGGAAGKAARTGKPEVLLFEKTLSIEDRLAVLRDNWGYTAEDARAVASTPRVSFLGVPLFARGSNRVIGVVYLDSTRENFFDAANNRLIINACHGVAAYISEKY